MNSDGSTMRAGKQAEGATREPVNQWSRRAARRQPAGGNNPTGGLTPRRSPAPLVLRLGDWLWLLSWVVAGSLWCVTAASEIGPTYDEPFYLEQGLQVWRTGSAGELLRKGTMPLPIVVTTAPLRAWELLRGQPIDLAGGFHQALALARSATLLFWALLLLYGFLLARQVGGPWAGRICVPLLACEPTLLANAALATTDVAVAACLLVFTYHYQTGRQRGWWQRVALPAALYTVALLAKASALVFAVAIMTALEVVHAWAHGARSNPSPQPPPRNGEGEPEPLAPPSPRSPCSARGTRYCGEGGWGGEGGTGPGWRQRLAEIRSALLSWSFRRDVLQIVSLGVGLTFLACGCDWQPERSFVAWSHGLPEGPFASGMVWLSEHLAVFQNAGVAIVRQIRHNGQGHGAYLLGTTSPTALWYFFPVALTIKLPVPLLLLPVCLALLWPRSLGNRLMVLAGVFLIFSLGCRVQIGTRLVFPLVVFFILGASVALANALTRADASWRRPVLGGLTGMAVVWMVTAAVSAWPNGLQYVNELWGGSGRGYLCVGGSDYDWGQGFPQLDRWAKGRSLALLYYGTDPAARASQYERLDALMVPIADISPEGIAAVLEGRCLAVSISLLYGPPLGSPALQQLLAYLRTQQPIASTDCFFIYHFPNSPTALPLEQEPVLVDGISQRR